MAETAKIAKNDQILFITRCYPPATGGMERFASDLVHTLSPRVEVHLLSFGGSKICLVYILPSFFLRGCWQLFRNQIRIIHTQDGVTSIVGALLKVISRKPLCVVVHGLDVTYRSKIYQRLIRWSLSKADHVVCISQAAEVEVRKIGVPQTRCSVIPLGVTDEIFTGHRTEARDCITLNYPLIQQDSYMILSVGRLVKRKGVAWFIASILPTIVDSHPNAVYVVCGDGPERAAVRAAIDDNKLAKHVLLVGQVSDKTLNSMYNGADCFVMPNIPVEGDMEGFGRVLVEAALCQMPVIASDLEGIPTAIQDGKNGKLVEPSSQRSYIKEINHFIDNPNRTRIFSKRARTYSIEHFSWDSIAHQYIHIYERIVKNHG